MSAYLVAVLDPVVKDTESRLDVRVPSNISRSRSIAIDLALFVCFIFIFSFIFSFIFFFVFIFTFIFILIVLFFFIVVVLFSSFFFSAISVVDVVLCDLLAFPIIFRVQVLGDSRMQMLTIRRDGGLVA